MEYETLTLRIPADLKQEIEQVAEREHRSLSGQVRLILEWFVGTTKDTKPEEKA